MAIFTLACWICCWNLLRLSLIASCLASVSFMADSCLFLFFFRNKHIRNKFTINLLKIQSQNVLPFFRNCSTNDILVDFTNNKLKHLTKRANTLDLKKIFLFWNTIIYLLLQKFINTIKERFFKRKIWWIIEFWNFVFKLESI